MSKSIGKPKCPSCGSENIKIMRLPIGDEEYIYCNDCKKVNVITKVKINEDS